MVQAPSSVVSLGGSGVSSSVVDRLDRDYNWSFTQKEWRAKYEDAINKLETYKSRFRKLASNNFSLPSGLGFTLFLFETCFKSFHDKAHPRIITLDQLAMESSQRIGLDNLFTVPIIQSSNGMAKGYNFQKTDFNSDELKILGENLREAYQVFSYPNNPNAIYRKEDEELDRLDLLAEIALKFSPEFEGIQRLEGKVLAYYSDQTDMDGNTLIPGLVLGCGKNGLVYAEPRNITHTDIPIGAKISWMYHHYRDALLHPEEVYAGRVLDISE